MTKKKEPQIYNCFYLQYNIETLCLKKFLTEQQYAHLMGYNFVKYHTSIFYLNFLKRLCFVTICKASPQANGLLSRQVSF